MALSDVKCRNARPASKLSKLSDGGGLQLWVQPTGTRLWRLAYRFDGKQKLLALGSYPLVSLAEARQARDDAKRLLIAGTDPGQERSLRKADSSSVAGSDRIDRDRGASAKKALVREAACIPLICARECEADGTALGR
jgi:hypothetical protein